MEDIIDIIVTETTNLIEITSQPTDEIIDVNIIDNREDVTLNVTPTVVEININSLTGNFGVNWGEITGTLSNQTDLQNALNLKADLVGGKVPSSQLPSYVDDVVEVANYAALPATGETGKIYVTIDTNYIYRWTGSVYVEIKDSSAVWGAITGTLSSQTDLQNALNAKLNTSTAASTYVPYTGATGNVNLGLDYSLTAALIIKSGGTSTQFLKADGSIDTNTYATTSQLHNPVTIGTANGLSLSTQVLSLGLASSSTNGALSSTDWSTFNAKQAALNGTGFVKISGTTISYDNSTYLTTSAAASTYVSGSGTTNYLPRWSSSKVLTDSFVYTNGNYTEIQGQGLTASMGIVVAGRYGSVANAPKIYSSDETTGVAHIEFVNGGGEIRLGVEKSTGGQILPGSSAYATVLTAGLSGRNLEFGTNNTKRMTISGSTGAVTLTGALSGTTLALSGGIGGINFTSSTTITNTASSGYTAIYANGGGLYLGGAASTNHLSIVSAGYVGIGTSNPAGGISGTEAALEISNSNVSVLAITSLAASGKKHQIYSSNDGGLYFRDATSSSQRMMISSSGNVGIGTTSPTIVSGFTDLTIDGSSGSFIDLRYNGSDNGRFVSSAGIVGLQSLSTTPLTFNTNGSERMRITSSGNVGIGTTSPNKNSVGRALTVNASSGNSMYELTTLDSSTTAYWEFTGTNSSIINVANGYLRFGTNNAENMRITSGGDVVIGKTSATFGTAGIQLLKNGQAAFTIANDALIYLNRQGTDGIIQYFYKDSSIVGSISVTSTLTSYNVTSDYRLKEDLKPINGLDIVNKIKVYDYKWKADNSRMDGVLAHELQEVLPYAVTGVKDGEQMQSVDYSKIVPVMVQAIKDLKAELDTLKNK